MARPDSDTQPAGQPRVSCIMPTFNRRERALRAVECFLRQDFGSAELVIVDDGDDGLGEALPASPRLRYVHLPARLPLGTKRNLACEQAGGELILHWDDDDWSAPWRVRYQVEAMDTSGADISGLNRVYFLAEEPRRAWEFVFPSGGRPWVYGASLCYRREFWHRHRFPDVNTGEDNRFVWSDQAAKIAALEDPRFLVAFIHTGNTSPKNTADARYRPRPVAEVEALMRPAGLAKGQETQGPAQGTTAPSPEVQRTALVTAAAGVGDILRVTPLIRALHLLGYAVDVLVLADYPGAAALLRGAAEIREVFVQPRLPAGAPDATLVPAVEYDLATFTTWSAGLKQRVKCRRSLAFDRRSWLVQGDGREVEHMIRTLGWEGDLPPPFAVASSRRFGLPAGTVALHPGCKRDWPWKKWHGFAELAARFPRVVVVGSEEDRAVDGTYFKIPFAWPGHVQDFTGRLSLGDTAALLKECALLVSNDSGLMHLGAALEVPTIGLFGITSPAREALRSPHLHPLSKGLDCEAECRRGAWGRRDCHRHLECLKTLTADEVLAAAATVVPGLEVSPPPPAPPANREPPRESINLAYYGRVFDLSGYGRAARSYLHALHRAGVNLSIVDLADGGRGVDDPLLQSLVGRKLEADFHLFHGIPPQWSRRAFPLRNVIAMTVWETDTMPAQWRAPLNHAVEVWLPCEFNTEVFGRALQRPVFKLPHPLMPAADAGAGEDAGLPGVNPSDIVFYSIFEWQDRKGPAEMIEAFLTAGAATPEAVLVLKTNGGAAEPAAALVRAIRARTGSPARVLLCCASWSDGRVAALHARGDVYVSLHWGEGWNLPLFEAAAHGKPVIATAYSGPLEYLDPAEHDLVRCTPAPVRQRYAYYTPLMKWARPDVGHAAQLIGEVLAQRQERSARAARAAGRIRERYSLESVGAAGLGRLRHLLRQTNRRKWQRLQDEERRLLRPPPVPIPGSWYDAGYFEDGVKSNWTEGYHWESFGGLFRETAAFLSQVFPGANTFLDAGCAKGFLVRSLRELGREAAGFDHSAWALEHADETTRPLLHLVDAADASALPKHDVLVAMSLFEGLTEAQAVRFLEQMRSRSRRALFAVIQLVGPAGGPDRDRSHITLRTRDWWHELFQRAGWEAHPVGSAGGNGEPWAGLPRRMGWDLFLYQPRGPREP